MFEFLKLPCELTLGRFSLGTRCMTVVLPSGKLRTAGKQTNEEAKTIRG